MLLKPDPAYESIERVSIGVTEFLSSWNFHLDNFASSNIHKNSYKKSASNGQ